MCKKTCECLFLAILSILLGVGIGVLYFNAFLTGIAAAISVAILLAFVALIVLAILAKSGKDKECVCKVGKCVLGGSIVTIILGVVASAITLATASIIFAILIGLGGAAFFFTLFTLIALIDCAIECDKCDYRE